MVLPESMGWWALVVLVCFAGAALGAFVGATLAARAIRARWTDLLGAYRTLLQSTAQASERARQEPPVRASVTFVPEESRPADPPFVATGLPGVAPCPASDTAAPLEASRAAVRFESHSTNFASQPLPAFDLRHRDPTPSPPAERRVISTAVERELTDEEIDALPPEIPQPGKPRKRILPPPKRPKLSSL